MQLSSSGLVRSSGTSFASVRSIVVRSAVFSTPGVAQGGLGPNSSSSISLYTGDFFRLVLFLENAGGATFVEVLRRLLACTASGREGEAAFPRSVGGIVSEKELAGLSKRPLSSKVSKESRVDWDSPAMVEEESCVLKRSGALGFRVQPEGPRGALMLVVVSKLGGCRVEACGAGG